MRAWAEKYKDQGLVVIGVHTPEFAFEKNVDNVKRAVSDLKVDYPVAVDNDYAIWRAFQNNYWPTHYVINGERLHQLVRQSGPIDDSTFDIEFLDPGVRAFAFTFG